jgi:hypothetical protein
VRTAYLWNGAADRRIAVGNHGEAPVSFTLLFTFGNDCADVF